jgi:hypothetical protein
MTILVTIAEIIGFAVLGIVLALLIMMAVFFIGDLLRARFPKFDRWLYDDVRRWNKRRRNRPPSP